MGMSPKWHENMDAVFDGLRMYDTSGINSLWPYLFDLVFHVGFSFFLVAMLSSIIIDQFHQNREDRKRQQVESSSACQICFIRRDRFEQVGLDFDYHVMKEHNYVDFWYFFKYLLERDEDQLTGTERQLRAKLTAKDTSFFPLHKTR